MPQPEREPQRHLDLSSLLLSPHLGRTFAEANHALYLVGGSVRNLLLDLPPGDLDFTTDARPEQVKRLIRRAGGHPVPIGEKFGTIAGVFDGEQAVEITTFRADTYTPGSRKPEVEFGDSLEGDLSRRDFTINALAVDAQGGELIDPFGGQGDLERRFIRAVGDAESRFAEDPLRLLRAVRFAAQLGFEIAPDTWLAIQRQADTLASISRERVRDELTKILTSTRAGKGIRMLVDLGLMPHVIPAVLELRGMQQGQQYRHKDVYEHTLQVVEGVPPTLALRLAALLHDIAKPRTRTVDKGQVHFFGHDRVGAKMSRRILADLRYPADTIQHVSRLVDLHLRPNSYEPDWTDGAVRRFMREAGAELDDLLALSRADVTTASAARLAAAQRRVDLLERRVAEIRAREDVAQLRSPLDGNDLMAMFGRGPGPWIKLIKDPLTDKVIDGELAQDDRATAEQIARDLYARLDRDGEGETT